MEWRTIWLVRAYDENDFLLDAEIIRDRTESEAAKEAESWANGVCECADWSMVDLGDINGYQGMYKL